MLQNIHIHEYVWFSTLVAVVTSLIFSCLREKKDIWPQWLQKTFSLKYSCAVTRAPLNGLCLVTLTIIVNHTKVFLRHMLSTMAREPSYKNNHSFMNMHACQNQHQRKANEPGFPIMLLKSYHTLWVLHKYWNNAFLLLLYLFWCHMSQCTVLLGISHVWHAPLTREHTALDVVTKENSNKQNNHCYSCWALKNWAEMNGAMTFFLF